jgi:hypothetical protein
VLKGHYYEFEYLYSVQAVAFYSEKQSRFRIDRPTLEKTVSTITVQVELRTSECKAS